jgi:acyl dehydratase
MFVGDELVPAPRRAPDAAQIATYAAASDVRERLFVDAGYARSHGFRGTVVPGPMLSAFLEHFVRRELQGWRLEALGATFRVPTIAASQIILRGVVTERHEMADGERLVCDLVIEHADGERAVTGSARLFRPHGAATDGERR